MSTGLRNTIFRSLRRKRINCEKNFLIGDKYDLVSTMDVAILNRNDEISGLVKCSERYGQGGSDRMLLHDMEVMKEYGVRSFILTEGDPRAYSRNLLPALRRACEGSNVSTGNINAFRRWSNEFVE